MSEYRQDHHEKPAPRWPERSSRDRGLSPTKTKLQPHPDKENHPQWDGLPPCDCGIGVNKPCPRSAVWHYGFGYYCAEHMEAREASEDYEAASMAVYHARRFLWKASVELIDRLEYHIGNALSELVEEQQATEVEMNAAYERAGGRS